MDSRLFYLLLWNNSISPDMGQALLMWNNSRIGSISSWPAPSFPPILGLFAGTITIFTVLLLITLTLALFLILNSTSGRHSLSDCPGSPVSPVSPLKTVIRFFKLRYASQDKSVFCMRDIWFEYNTSCEWLVYSIEQKQCLKVFFRWTIKS